MKNLSAARKTRGFTLIELIIVLVILGILAAIVIPRFTATSEQAKASALEESARSYDRNLRALASFDSASAAATPQDLSYHTRLTTADNATGAIDTDPTDFTGFAIVDGGDATVECVLFVRDTAYAVLDVSDTTSAPGEVTSGPVNGTPANTDTVAENGNEDMTSVAFDGAAAGTMPAACS